MKFVQYHPSYCEEAKDAPVRDWDTSHDATVLYDDGTRAKAGHFKHADWAQVFCDLMNARHEGGERAEKVRERVARAIFVADCPPNMIPKDWDSPMILGAGNAHRNRVYAMADAAIAVLTEER